MHPLPSVPAALARRQSVGGWLVVLPAVRVSITASHCVLSITSALATRGIGGERRFPPPPI